MKELWGSFVIACSMYSRIPLPQVEWTRERMKYALCFFPVVGAVTGALTAAALLGLRGLGFPVFGAAAAAVMPLLVTGGIHMDGFLDVTDARASHGTREQKLEILKDPHTGAFAIISAMIYLLLYTGAVGEMKEGVVLAFGASFILTRALSGLAVVTFPMAKSSGLAATFSAQADRQAVACVMAVYVVLAQALIWLAGGMAAGLVSALLAVLVYLYYYWMSRREFGGITGDLAGYFLQLLELFLAVGLAALSHFAG